MRTGESMSAPKKLVISAYLQSLLRTGDRLMSLLSKTAMNKMDLKQWDPCADGVV